MQIALKVLVGLVALLLLFMGLSALFADSHHGNRSAVFADVFENGFLLGNIEGPVVAKEELLRLFREGSREILRVN